MPLPFLFTREYMTKKCGNCGAPAPDSNSRFCDLCGAALKEEPVTPQGFPVCPACGAIVSDKIAQFCDVCGAPLAKPVCPVCGNTAPSIHSKFCTRCGATFVPATPIKSRAVPPAIPVAAPEPEPEPVVVKIRKGRVPMQEHPQEEWDPWTDDDPTFDVQNVAPQEPLQEQKQYAYLPLVADELASPAETVSYQAPQIAQISVPKKKYSHLPLIADELKEDAERRSAANSDNGGQSSSHSDKRGKKKGMFGFK
jgi:hypothetical protein